MHDLHVMYIISNRSGSSWLYVVPFGIRRVANWVKQQYGDVPIYFTENGVSDNTGTLDDYDRIKYLRSYINEVLKGKVSDNTSCNFVKLYEKKIQIKLRGSSCWMNLM